MNYRLARSLTIIMMLIGLNENIYPKPSRILQKTKKLIDRNFVKPINKALDNSITSSTQIFNTFLNNIHKVPGHNLYRSKQLTYKQEKDLIRSKNIRIVIGLRGIHPEASWYREQKRAAQETGATFVCAKTSENSLPPMHELLIMLAIIHNPKAVINNGYDLEKNPCKYVLDPNASTKDNFGNEISIKANCKAGVDRTGMFCALFILERELKNNMSDSQTKKILKKAQNQLYIKYGHLSLVHPTMDKFIKDWWTLRKNNSLQRAIELYTPFNNRLF